MDSKVRVPPYGPSTSSSFYSAKPYSTQAKDHTNHTVSVKLTSGVKVVLEANLVIYN